MLGSHPLLCGTCLAALLYAIFMSDLLCVLWNLDAELLLLLAFIVFYSVCVLGLLVSSNSSLYVISASHMQSDSPSGVAS